MISVVVPIYNVEKYIIGCLESILNQDFQDFELILVNDGSKDDSIRLSEDFLKDKNLSWKIINKENGGLASARNAGLKNANGDYVVFIDADDAISNIFLTSLYKQFDENTDFTFCAFQYMKTQVPPYDENNEKKIFNKDELMDAFLKRTIAFVVPSMMFRKNFLIDNNLYFDEDIRFSEDQPFLWNVILHSERSVYLYKKMYGYYLRENSIMTGSSASKVIDSYREFKEVIDAYFAPYPQYEGIKKILLPRWQLGALYTSARICEYTDFKKIYDEMDGKAILKHIVGIGEIKAYLLATICSISPRLLYKLCRRMDLNG